MDDIRAKFLPRFVALAQERLGRGLAAAKTRRYEETNTLVRDLHALAGEAGLLGLGAVLEVARRAEDAARRVHESRAEEDGETLTASLRELAEAVSKVEGSSGS